MEQKRNTFQAKLVLSEEENMILFLGTFFYKVSDYFIRSKVENPDEIWKNFFEPGLSKVNHRTRVYRL